MIGAAIIVLREVFEAALVIGIMLAATRPLQRRGRWIAAGAALGVTGSILVAWLAEHIAAALAGFGQEIFNAGVLFAAASMLGWHHIWMKRHGAGLARDLNETGARAVSGAAPLSALLLVIALAVLREGSEVVLFLYGVAAGGANAAQLLAGSALGLAGGALLGALLYLGLLRIPARHLFSVTGLLLLVLASGMASQGSAFLVQAGRLPPLADPLWDSSGLVPQQSLVGQLLHALVGYADRPSGMQMAVFAVTAVAVSLLSWLAARAPGQLSRGVARASLLLLACLASRDARADLAIYSPIVEQGEHAFEYRGRHDFDSRRDVGGGETHKLEFEYAPTAAWLTEVLGEWEREPGGALHATEVAWENVLQLTPQGRYWADIAVLGEYAHSLARDGHDGVELGLLAEKEHARRVYTLNLLAERPLAGGAGTATRLAMRWRWRWQQALEPGVEFHGELHDPEAAAGAAPRRLAGPALYGALRPAGDRRMLRYEAALLAGLNDASPAATVRVKLEYEF
jgi:FTR1 family protein